MRPHLRSLTPQALADLCSDLPLELRLARRIVSRVVNDEEPDLAAVDGLSRLNRAAVLERTNEGSLEILERRASSVDPFVKYLFRSPRGGTFEAVRIPLEIPRWSACISSQVGCALACAFCQTGKMGLTRNLEPWEMVDQVLTIRREAPERPLTGVVFQGQGEPFHNYDNVIRAAEVLRDPCGGRIRGDRMTISTAGMLPQMLRFADEGHPYRLILSLTSAFQDKRVKLMPVGKSWHVADLAEAMRKQARHFQGLVHLAWVLISGENTQPEEARELRKLFPQDRVRVSIIDVNDPTGEFQRAGDEERKRFLGALDEQGISFVRRYSGGPDIHAACGMLAQVRQGGQPLASMPSPSAD